MGIRVEHYGNLLQVTASKKCEWSGSLEPKDFVIFHKDFVIATKAKVDEGTEKKAMH